MTGKGELAKRKESALSISHKERKQKRLRKKVLEIAQQKKIRHQRNKQRRENKGKAPLGEEMVPTKRPSILMEMGFLPSASPLPDFIAQTIEALGWHNFYMGAKTVKSTTVTAFYEGKPHSGRYKVDIGDASIGFGISKINRIFNLKDTGDTEGNQIIENPTAEEQKKALKLVALPGKKLSISVNGVKMLSPHDLKPKANVWLYFIKRKLMPKTHNHTTSWEIVMTIYCIMRRIPINVGKMIADQILTLFSD